MTFVDLDLPVDPDEAIGRLIADFKAEFPGVRLSDARAIEAALTAIGRRDADNSLFGQRVHAAAFDAFGSQIIRVERITGSPAQIQSTWTMRDAAGYTIPAASLAVVYPVTGTDLAVFRPTEDIVVEAGALTATDVTLVCDEIGSHRNGLPATTLRLAVADARIASVTATSTSTGGVDPESDTTWLNRLAAEITLTNRNPVTGPQFAIAARRIDEVWRARAIARYDAATDTPMTPGHVTVVPITIDGQAVSAAAKDALALELGGSDNHIAGFTLHLLDPTYVPVAVHVEYTLRSGFDEAAVAADIHATLNRLLQPAGFAGGGNEPPVWDDTDVVARHDLIGALYGIAGLERVTLLTLNGAEDDVALPAITDLPAPTITVAVAA